MDDIFNFPAPTMAKPKGRPVYGAAPTDSHINVVASKSSPTGVKYARLSHEDHANLRNTIEVLDELRGESGQIGAAMRAVCDQKTRNYAKELNRIATLGDMLDGVKRRLNEPHPQVTHRKGKDCTITQLRDMNRIIDGFNAEVLNGPTLIPIPTK